MSHMGPVWDVSTMAASLPCHSLCCLVHAADPVIPKPVMLSSCQRYHAAQDMADAAAVAAAALHGVEVVAVADEEEAHADGSLLQVGGWLGFWGYACMPVWELRWSAAKQVAWHACCAATRSCALLMLEACASPAN
jgi:hypothetical protein